MKFYNRIKSLKRNNEPLPIPAGHLLDDFTKGNVYTIKDKSIHAGFLIESDRNIPIWVSKTAAKKFFTPITKNE